VTRGWSRWAYEEMSTSAMASIREGVRVQCIGMESSYLWIQPDDMCLSSTAYSGVCLVMIYEPLD